MIEIGGRRILHTGDFCLHNQRTIGGMDLSKISDIDVLFIESTYAYQPEYKSETVEEQQYQLSSTVHKVISNGGNVLIPAFSLGRAQEISVLFRDYFEQGVLPPFDVRLDGLVKPVTEIYHNNRNFLQGRLQTRFGHVVYSDFIQPMPDGFYPTDDFINQLESTCIISSSGMLLDRTRSASYAQLLLPQSKNGVFFSGYLDAESPGSKLMQLQNSNGSCLINGRWIKSLANVSHYHLSAHAPSQDLIKVIRQLKPNHVILSHGDYHYDGDSQFMELLIDLEKIGISVHQAANGVQIFF